MRATTAIPRVVIAGGGVVGNSIAYYLAKNHGTPCTVVDPVGIAPAASGKAAGFLARDWSNDTPCLGALQRRSFDLHAELGEAFGDRTDYRRVSCVAVALDAASSSSGKRFEGVEWVDAPDATSARSMGDESSLAQVHPRKLCEALWESVLASNVGSELATGRRVVEAVLDRGDDDDDDAATPRVTGVRLDDGAVLEADVLVAACGPWTEEAKRWFRSAGVYGTPSVYGVKYHALLVDAALPVSSSRAVFFRGAPGGDPEMYPRPDGDLYVTGFPDPRCVVRERPGEEEVREEVVARLRAAANAVSSELKGRALRATTACHLPTTRDGLPAIGPVPGVDGAYVATGHSCWGILNGPATGEAMAELIVEGTSSHVDLAPFRVERLNARSLF